ncbi:MAG: hypothetical protein JOZ68_20250 [Acidimicrobiia bacterium]|nr:hypothetical protein [Acidimicrobiia bacterium]MBV9043331.1 hypothetical protein [Acidimicrobiia bacterium]
MSGLMVSLAVVVAAILAVLFLVFSDQPATQRAQGRRASLRRVALGRDAVSSEDQPLVLRGPPPAHVLQQQLALPSSRPRTPPPSTTSASAPVARSTVADRTYEVRLAREEGVTVFSRVRSSVALLVLLTAVGATVAISIGVVMYLAGLALRHTLR